MERETHQSWRTLPLSYWGMCAIEIVSCCHLQGKFAYRILTLSHTSKGFIFHLLVLYIPRECMFCLSFAFKAINLTKECNNSDCWPCNSTVVTTWQVNTLFNLHFFIFKFGYRESHEENPFMI